MIIMKESISMKIFLGSIFGILMMGIYSISVAAAEETVQPSMDNPPAIQNDVPRSDWVEPNAASDRPELPRRPAIEANEKRERTITVFTQFDHWLPADAFEQDKNSVNDFNAHYSGDPLDDNVSAGSGLREGMLFRTKTPGLKMGLSIGQVKGPELTVKDAYDSFTFNKNVTKVDFYRALIEVEKTVPLFEDVDFKLKGGVGAAKGWMEFKSDTPSFSSTIEHGWTGPTWEVGPSFVFHLGLVLVEVGMSYAQFPQMKENEDFFEFRWMPTGYKVAVLF